MWYLALFVGIFGNFLTILPIWWWFLVNEAFLGKIYVNFQGNVFWLNPWLCKKKSSSGSGRIFGQLTCSGQTLLICWRQSNILCSLQTLGSKQYGPKSSFKKMHTIHLLLIWITSHNDDQRFISHSQVVNIVMLVCNRQTA